MPNQPLPYHPKQGEVLRCDFCNLMSPEMDKVTLPLDSVSHNRDHELACLASHSLSNCIGLT